MLEIIAVIAAGIFAGAAVYINLVEHPARLLALAGSLSVLARKVR